VVVDFPWVDFEWLMSHCHSRASSPACEQGLQLVNFSCVVVDLAWLVTPDHSLHQGLQSGTIRNIRVRCLKSVSANTFLPLFSHMEATALERVAHKEATALERTLPDRPALQNLQALSPSFVS
jgi:hypothetical protein